MSRLFIGRRDMSKLFHGVPTYHGHDIAWDSFRTTGAKIVMDPTERRPRPVLPLDRLRPGSDRQARHPDRLHADRPGPGRARRSAGAATVGPTDLFADPGLTTPGGPLAGRQPAARPERGRGAARRLAGRRGPDARRGDDRLRPGRRPRPGRQHPGEALQLRSARRAHRAERRLRLRHVPGHRPGVRAARRDGDDPRLGRRHGQDADGVGRLVGVRLGPPRRRRHARARTVTTAGRTAGPSRGATTRRRSPGRARSSSTRPIRDDRRRPRRHARSERLVLDRGVGHARPASDALSGLRATYYTLDGGKKTRYTGPVAIAKSGDPRARLLVGRQGRQRRADADGRGQGRRHRPD